MNMTHQNCTAFISFLRNHIPHKIKCTIHMKTNECMQSLNKSAPFYCILQIHSQFIKRQNIHQRNGQAEQNTPSTLPVCEPQSLKGYDRQSYEKTIIAEKEVGQAHNSAVLVAIYSRATFVEDDQLLLLQWEEGDYTQTEEKCHYISLPLFLNALF